MDLSSSGLSHFCLCCHRVLIPSSLSPSACVCCQDPFFVPRSEEELEFHGAADATPNLARDLVDHVRRRKGLAIQQKTVEHAEKQRTIKR